MQIKETTVGRVMKVHPGRFDPPGMVVVTAVHAGSTQEASFRHLESGKTGRLYTAHLYVDGDCTMKTIELSRAKKAEAAKIGLNTRHPKRR